jgi:hypothetical protein
MTMTTLTTWLPSLEPLALVAAALVLTVIA